MFKKFIVTLYSFFSYKKIKENDMSKYPKFNENFLQCPVCNGDWDGGDIVEELFKQDYYKTLDDAKEAAKSYGWSESNPTRFKKYLSIEIQGEYDGISQYQCPHCDSNWSSFTNTLLSYKGTKL